MADEKDTVHYTGSEGGWGSLRGITETALRERPSPGALNTLRRQNKVKGFMCVSCAWTKPAEPHAFEFCENGAKATLWELTSRRATPDFFANHTLAELKGWTDHQLEQTGRLTHPMRYDRPSDKYVPCTWDEAFAAIGSELKAIDPSTSVFYASGRASLETSYLYALFARLYGHNNLPDSSNMCHETTSVALKGSIGSPVGTSVLADFHLCDAIFFFGQNPGTNSPRLLHPLQEAVQRGCKIVTFNPVREKGLETFKNPQSPVEMLTPKSTQISTLYLQVKTGGDIAAITGMIKHVLAREEALWARDKRHVLDVDFIEQHTTGFDELKAKVDATSWAEIERESGLARADIEAAADIYCDADRAIAMYGMGLTQHVGGARNIKALVNLWLLRGNIGRDGTGVSPVRGHSNVQGQRTVGISEKPELVPLDKLAEQFGFEPPRDEGMNTVKACERILTGEVKAFIGLGGNFVRAIPERDKMEAAWTRLRLTVQIATKLNRSHLINGEVAYLLPCLGRSEEDMQVSGRQAVTMEDSLSCIHGSIGRNTPASKQLLSEVAIVAGMARATLPENPKVKWEEWTADYSKIRSLIAETYPEQFHDFNDRVFTPGGFYRGNSARERVWKTKSGKAQFTVPTALNSMGVGEAEGRYRLMTMRSNDQFNTTIYGYSDRLRGIEGTRDVLLMNPEDIKAAGLRAGQVVGLASDAEDGEDRQVGGLTVTPFLLPRGCLGAYYPEMNPLMPLWYHDEESHTPAAKSVPVRIVS
ncbi:FdhF/YdeP family oxidoreductase [Sphingomonas jatrophae]|uniref:Oxidoreductase alpha (Molybdopterin) subunit n=1 Tax=Sphingomonas jatrophae TaxID=1166337 RepID=A0A1I6K1B7_9SPHN|nr:FdhF/YdeP family oxidoreductase [Sphingomonas jatrophae]SFR85042.1 oxidoreductase alpha (molybdopterin) subunit [Sphingomonas jatrophae]